MARGVARAFADRGAATPPGEIWRPSHQEILAAHLATRHADPARVALSGVSPDGVERLHLTLREISLHEALFEFERPLFDRLAEGLKDGYRRGLSEPEAVPFLGGAVRRLLRHDLPRTSDQAARDYFVALAAVGRALERQGPQACLAFLGERGATAAPLGGERLDALLEATARVIRDARNAPRPVPARGEVLESLLGAYDAAEADHPGLDDLEDEAALARPAAHCDALLDVAEAMARGEPAISGPLIRYATSLEEEDEVDEAGRAEASGAAGR